MRNLMLISMLFATTTTFAQTQETVPLKKNLAAVEQMQGMYIFVNATPVAEYDYLGTVKYSNTLGLSSDQFTAMRDKLIKRAQKDFPTADGLIFHFTIGAADKCDAIKFKNQ